MIQSQSLILGLRVPHAFKLPPGTGLPLFVLGGLILWLVFLALIGAFKK